MLMGMPHSLIMFGRTVVQLLRRRKTWGIGTNVAYLENLFTITKMNSISPTLGRCVMKSRETFFHNREGIGRGSNSPAILFSSTLSCWQIRHVFVNCVTLFWRLGGRRFSATHCDLPMECDDILWVGVSLGSLNGDCTNDSPWWIVDCPRPKTSRFSPL